MMDFGLSPAEEIEQLELRIEELEGSIARSRRLMKAGGAAAICGPVLLLALMLGVLAYSPARTLIGLALTIGGVVLTGSSKSSTEHLERSLQQAEQERNAAIDALGLSPIGGASD
jgi:hypothetical protein